MRKIAGIARYTFIEIFRNKVYYVLLLFAFVLIGSALLLGSLGGEQRARMITDMGLASIETFSLIIAVFAAATLVLEEMEARTLYLILSRPVARYQFIVGRFAGLVAMISATYAVMALAHVLLLLSVHIPINSHYLLSLFFSWEKIVLITALALVFSLFSTSTISGVTFTLFFWIMGHLSGEIRYLSHKAQPLVSVLCTLFYYLAPNFQILNVRDLPLGGAGIGWLWPAAGYGIFYTLACLGIAVALFRKKEF